MRSTLRIVALVLVLLVLLVPLAAYAGGGTCPDDPVASKDCAKEAPPYYVVSNRSFERLGPEYGTGCQPWILKNPDCTTCDDSVAECLDAAALVEQEICGFEMPEAGAQAGDVLYEMCCNCSSTAGGTWVYRERTLQQNAAGAWECPNPGDWQEGLPPETGIDLPAPIIIGGLALIGAALLTAGLLVRRRTLEAV